MLRFIATTKLIKKLSFNAIINNPVMKNIFIVIILFAASELVTAQNFDSITKKLLKLPAQYTCWKAQAVILVS